MQPNKQSCPAGHSGPRVFYIVSTCIEFSAHFRPTIVSSACPQKTEIHISAAGVLPLDEIITKFRTRASANDLRKTKPRNIITPGSAGTCRHSHDYAAEAESIGQGLVQLLRMNSSPQSLVLPPPSFFLHPHRFLIPRFCSSLASGVMPDEPFASARTPRKIV